MSAERSWMRRSAVVVLIAVAVFASGCGSKSDNSANTQAGTDNATTDSPGNPAAPVMTFTWNSASNCVHYRPDTLTVRLGAHVNFNNSSIDTVWVTAPAGCFSAAETTFAVPRGNNSFVQTHQAGAYVLATRPAGCSSITGGAGPALVVDSGMGGSQ